MRIDSNANLAARMGMRENTRRVDAAAARIAGALDIGVSGSEPIDQSNNSQLSDAMIDVITAQRAFSANRSVARVSDEIVHELIRIAERNSDGG